MSMQRFLLFNAALFTVLLSAAPAAGQERTRRSARERTERPARRLRGDALPESATFRSPDLVTWLSKHPRVGKALIWRFDGQSKSYADWPERAKAALHQAFDSSREGKPLGSPDPPRAFVEELGSSVTINETDAARLYFHTTAHCLAVEIDNKVRWSIVDYSDENLEVLFRGDYMFRLPRGRRDASSRKNTTGVTVAAGRLACSSAVTPAPPDVVYKFLQRERAIKATRFDTIVAMLGWCQHHLTHAGGSLEGAAYMEYHWEYPGNTPVSRMIAGIHRNRGRLHYTLGCGGTTGFLQSVLRVVNIPVTAHQPAGHVQPGFPTEGKYLSHGDDPYAYARYWRPKGEPCPYNPRDLLIDQRTFDAWFGPGVPAEMRGNNVGRRPQELTLKVLPPFIVRAYLDDAKNRRRGEESSVRQMLSGLTSEELDRAKLWQRLAVKARNYRPRQ